MVGLSPGTVRVGQGPGSPQNPFFGSLPALGAMRPVSSHVLQIRRTLLSVGPIAVFSLPIVSNYRHTSVPSTPAAADEGFPSSLTRCERHRQCSWRRQRDVDLPPYRQRALAIKAAYELKRSDLVHSAAPRATNLTPVVRSLTPVLSTPETLPDVGWCAASRRAAATAAYIAS